MVMVHIQCMTNAETYLTLAVRAELDELAKYADEPPTTDIGRAAAKRLWRRAVSLLADCRRHIDTDDLDAYTAVADLTETLHSCEAALKLGSAAPVAEVA